MLVQFNITANDLVMAVNRNTASTHASLDNLARLFASQAHRVSSAATATAADDAVVVTPMITVHDFEGFAMAARDQTGARVIAYTPFIGNTPQDQNDAENATAAIAGANDEARMEWEAYAMAEQGWIQTAAAFYPSSSTSNNVQPIKPRIWLLDGNGDAMEDPTTGPYAPIWQRSPPPPIDNTSIVNFNLASDALVKEWMDVQLKYSNDTWSFLTAPIWSSDSLLGATTTTTTTTDGEQDIEKAPTSLALIPVAQSLYSRDDPVTGAIVADIPWSSFFRNVSTPTALVTDLVLFVRFVGVRLTQQASVRAPQVLPGDQPAVVVVVESCGTVHSYSVEPSAATFLGNGDHHDTSFDHLVVQGTLGSFASSPRRGVTVPCLHRIHVFPTTANEEFYGTESPHVFAVGASVCFFFAIVLFLVYDCYVRIQQNRVVGEAERSQALVASLFPGKVARRLFDDRSVGNHSSVLDQSNHSAHLLNFVTKSENKATNNSSTHDRPIAELFPEATVMFAE